jgi:ketosteroid isomerase-like protein
MTNVPDTKLGRLYREHINLILKKDIEALLDQYTPDALLISSFMKKPAYYKGRDQLREHMQGILITEQITLKTPQGDAHMRFADSWVLKNGKIAIHFAGMVQYPDGSLA